MKRIALLGGAFNPITKGHLEIAQLVKDRLGCEVWIMPAYSHTYNKKMVSPEHRIKMCKLAAPSFKIFDYEIKNKIKGGTLSLYNILKEDKEYKDYDFSWIIGMDNANTIENWVNAEELLDKVKFIVIPRPGVKEDPTKTWYKQSPHIFIESYLKDYVFEISSTKVRTLLTEYYKKRNFYTLQDLEHYIETNLLYYIIINKLYEKIY